MGLNETPSSERIHIGFFGLRNVGKSSLVNAVTGQELSVVSDIKGTTTDPVVKAMELKPLGPVVVIDTPGMDDLGRLGELRVKQTRKILAKTDLAVLVADATADLGQQEREMIELFKERNLPYLIVYNKADLLSSVPYIAVPSGEKIKSAELTEKQQEIYVSALTGENIYELKERIGSFAGHLKKERFLVSDLLTPGDLVLLVIPIDESAPKGRLILPQQLVMRDILDCHGIALACQEDELKKTLSSLSRKPRLVITDSQAFERVAQDTPDDIPLTSFSILMARYKGTLDDQILGAKKLASLKDGDRILISEGCTHHRQCKDIGTVKLPGWIESTYGVKPVYHFTSGGDFPEKLSDIDLVIHCGGCMLNEREMQRRIQASREAGVPIVNYGTAIAEMHGILERSIAPFKSIH